MRSLVLRGNERLRPTAAVSMLSFLVSCSVSASPNQGADLQQKLDHEVEVNAGRTMCRRTGGCAIRVTDLRKQHIRRACMAECDLKHKNNTTGHQLSAPRAPVGTLATVALPSGAQVVLKGARVGAIEAVALVAAGNVVMATEATSGTSVAWTEVEVVGATEAAALVAAGAVATVATEVVQRAK